MTIKAELEITFLGGASAIGASCALVQVADTSVLLDCGVRFRPVSMLRSGTSTPSW